MWRPTLVLMSSVAACAPEPVPEMEIESITPSEAPVGAPVVLRGRFIPKEIGTTSTTFVEFTAPEGTATIEASRVELEALFTIVPEGATSGPLRVVDLDLFEPSAPVDFTVIDLPRPWLDAAPLGRTSRDQRAVSLADGRVLLRHGVGRNGAGVRAAELLGQDGTWTPAPAPPAATSLAAPVQLADGRVLFAGGLVWRESGNGGPDASAAVELFDPGGTWSAGAPMTHARGAHTTTALADGRILVVGGYTPAPQYPTVAELYDPVMDSWQEAGSPGAGPRLYHQAVRLADGRVLVCGGFTSVTSEATATAELFDPATLTWQPAANLHEARAEHAAFALPDGRVIVVGGRSGTGALASLLASVEIYDPSTNTWSLVQPTSYPRYGAGVALLAGGKVLVAGGVDFSDRPLRTAELYDIASDRWSPLGSMYEGHSHPAIATLPDGDVLVIGGLGGYPQVELEERVERLDVGAL